MFVNWKESFRPLLELTLSSMNIRGCPFPNDTMLSHKCPHSRPVLYPASQFLRVFPIQQWGRLRNPQLRRSPSAISKFWECCGGGRSGPLLFCMCKRAGQLSASEAVGKSAQSFRRRASDSQSDLGGGCGPPRETVLYLPCEEN